MRAAPSMISEARMPRSGERATSPRGGSHPGQLCQHVVQPGTRCRGNDAEAVEDREDGAGWSALRWSESQVWKVSRCRRARFHAASWAMDGRRGPRSRRSGMPRRSQRSRRSRPRHQGRCSTTVGTEAATPWRRSCAIPPRRRARGARPRGRLRDDLVPGRWRAPDERFPRAPAQLPGR